MAISEPFGFTVLINNLDASNPLHVQNSDNSSSVIIPSKLLGTENYRIWSGAVKLALQARNKYGFVDGTCLRESYATSDVLTAQWDKFKKTYDKVDGSVVYNLLQKSNIVKQGGSLVADYYRRLNSIWREFDALAKLPKCTCEVKCSCDASKELGLHQQLMKLMQFLMGHYDCYQPVRSSLLTRDPIPEIKDAYNVVSREESHRGVPESYGVTESKMNASSFTTKTFNNSNNNKRCYELVGFPTRFKRSSNSAKQGFSSNIDVKQNEKMSSENSSPGFTFEQMKKLLSIINETPSASIHANMASKASFFNGNVWFNINFTKYFSANSSLSVKTITWGWIIDSGANQHLTVSNVGMFNIVDISELKFTVGHPNGTLAIISHVGNLKLTNNVILYDMLVVPGYCDWKREKVLGSGSETGGLYMFDMNNDCYVVCHMAKNTRELFPLSDHKSKSLGELVHLDLWGPYRVPIREGFKYFLTIVDDYSRAIW
ncbi:ribonuclease H-like domain-containing protein, partial [Tanacetum coccineum]